MLSRVVEQEPLKKHTYFRIGGPAAYFARPQNLYEAQEILDHFRGRGLPCLILGSGANLLVRDSGFPGLVLTLKQGTFLNVIRSEDGLRAGAGVSLSRLVQRALSCGLRGLEPLVGIPGTLGGAVAMNAGGSFGTIGDSVRSAALLCADGSLEIRNAGDLRFGYRSSGIAGEAIIWVDLHLYPENKERIMARMKRIVEEKKRTQPLRASSAGCVFKNPEGTAAGMLIEKAGLKGFSIGRAQVSPKHANFIVNLGGASCEEVLELIDVVRERVRERFGISLELELKIV